MVTNFPALPRGTTSVDVLFPGIDPLVAIQVSPRLTGPSGPAARYRRDTATWSYRRNRPQPGWSLSRWPTPVPVDRPRPVPQHRRPPYSIAAALPANSATSGTTSAIESQTRVGR